MMTFNVLLASLFRCGVTFQQCASVYVGVIVSSASDFVVWFIMRGVKNRLHCLVHSGTYCAE